MLEVREDVSKVIKKLLFLVSHEDDTLDHMVGISGGASGDFECFIDEFDNVYYKNFRGDMILVGNLGRIPLRFKDKFDVYRTKTVDEFRVDSVGYNGVRKVNRLTGRDFSNERIREILSEFTGREGSNVDLGVLKFNYIHFILSEEFEKFYETVENELKITNKVDIKFKEFFKVMNNYLKGLDFLNSIYDESYYTELKSEMAEIVKDLDIYEIIEGGYLNDFITLDELQLLEDFLFESKLSITSYEFMVLLDVISIALFKSNRILSYEPSTKKYMVYFNSFKDIRSLIINALLNLSESADEKSLLSDFNFKVLKDPYIYSETKVRLLYSDDIFYTVFVYDNVEDVDSRAKFKFKGLNDNKIIKEYTLGNFNMRNEFLDKIHENNLNIMKKLNSIESIYDLEKVNLENMIIKDEEDDLTCIVSVNRDLGIDIKPIYSKGLDLGELLYGLESETLDEKTKGKLLSLTIFEGTNTKVVNQDYRVKNYTSDIREYLTNLGRLELGNAQEGTVLYPSLDDIIGEDGLINIGSLIANNKFTGGSIKSNIFRGIDEIIEPRWYDRYRFTDKKQGGIERLTEYYVEFINTYIGDSEGVELRNKLVAVFNIFISRKMSTTDVMGKILRSIAHLGIMEGTVELSDHSVDENVEKIINHYSRGNPDPLKTLSAKLIESNLNDYELEKTINSNLEMIREAITKSPSFESFYKLVFEEDYSLQNFVYDTGKYFVNNYYGKKNKLGTYNYPFTPNYPIFNLELFEGLGGEYEWLKMNPNKMLYHILHGIGGKNKGVLSISDISVMSRANAISKIIALQYIEDLLTLSKNMDSKKVCGSTKFVDVILFKLNRYLDEVRPKLTFTTLLDLGLVYDYSHRNEISISDAINPLSDLNKEDYHKFQLRMSELINETPLSNVRTLIKKILTDDKNINRFNLVTINFDYMNEYNLLKENRIKEYKKEKLKIIYN